ncbi:MAG TPA: hypothetical protein PLO23_04850 [Alphaproteobacteria bacterium]|nr:hypothetical protein [Alphaproteobacteria bacterium]
MSLLNNPDTYTTILETLQNLPSLDSIKDLPLIDIFLSEDAKRLYTFGAGVGATHLWHRYKNRQNFQSAALGEAIAPEIKISLLQWNPVKDEKGKTIYDLHSTTKSMDLRKALPEEYGEELPKLLIAAAEQTLGGSSFLVDHIDTAARKYSGIFKTQASEDKFAKKIKNFIEEETKYIIQGQWGGGSVLQQAYEGGARGMEGFYGIWVHEKSDDLEEIRLLLLPEKYLYEPLPAPELCRVREGEKGGNGFYFDPTGNHSHLQRLKILQEAVTKLKGDSALRGTSWISLPVENKTPATAPAILPPPAVAAQALQADFS